MSAPRKRRSSTRTTAEEPGNRQQASAKALTASVFFGSEICTDLAAAEQREWLVTNGLGGFASGTVAGSGTRRYHGLLVASLSPPAQRTVLVSSLDELLHIGKETYELATHHWLSGAVAPEGYRLLVSFRLDGTVPVWTFRAGSVLIEKRIWMEQGENSTFVRYALLQSDAPAEIELKVLANYRDFHASTHAGDWRMEISTVERGVQVTAFPGAAFFLVKSAEADCQPQHIWYRDFFYPVERERGLDDHEDQLLVATFRAGLESGKSVTITLSTKSTANLDGDSALRQEQNRQAEVLAAGQALFSPEYPSASWLPRLLLAADQFIVSRALPGEPNGKSIIAGYPWFGDWGRDTMIALPGIALASGRPELAKQILLAFSRFVDRGMLPNNFPDAGGAPAYNTIDATLWYFEAIRRYFAATEDTATLKSVFPLLAQIIEAHLSGTRYNIHVDAVDGLLYGGGPGVQLTWMDAKVGEWVVTPRTGKPVEINALWINALDSMAGFAKVAGRDPSPYEQHSAKARSGFGRFWNASRNCCFDVIDSPGIGNDAALRPNQIFAVSLGIGALSPPQQRGVVDSCAEHLLTPFGLRSLAPGEPGYIGRYYGGPRDRDAAYHQGTVWGWLLGPFALAHSRVYNDRAAARAFLQTLAECTDRYGLGTLAEIYDGDPPHRPAGCIAQAWTVGEILRAWQQLQE